MSSYSTALGLVDIGLGLMLLLLLVTVNVIVVMKLRLLPNECKKERMKSWCTPYCTVAKN